MNLGHELAKWFTGAFGCTQAEGITGCDFSTTAGLNQDIDTDCVARCQVIARQVCSQSGAHDRLSGLDARQTPSPCLVFLVGRQNLDWSACRFVRGAPMTR